MGPASWSYNLCICDVLKSCWLATHLSPRPPSPCREMTLHIWFPPGGCRGRGLVASLQLHTHG